MSNQDDLLDVVAVQHTISRYADAVSRGDWERYASVFAPDCEWEILSPVPMREVGPEAITNAMRAMIEPMEFFAHMVHNIAVDIVGPGRAESHTTVHELARHPGVVDGVICGIYADELEKDDAGVWRFTHRRFTCTYFEADALAGETVTPREQLP